MAQTVNVLIDFDNKKFDLNKMGLINMSFNKVMDTRNVLSTHLADLSITMQDTTGGLLSAIIQGTEGRIRFQYGLSNHLSQVYTVDILELNTNLENGVHTIGIGAIASYRDKKFEAQVFKPNTNVYDIVVAMAARNGWFIGNSESDIRNYVDVNVLLSDFLTKPSNMTDIDFIQNMLLPICNKAVYSEQALSNYYDFKLTMENNRKTLYFRRYTRTTTRRVWNYTYGVTTEELVLSLTNKIDMSFLLDGLYVQLPLTAEERSIRNTDELLSELLTKKVDYVKAQFKAYNLPQFAVIDNFKFRVEAVDAEGEDNLTPEEAIEKAIDNAIQTVNVAELVVVGNPDIMVSDLVDLTIKTNSGMNSMISSIGTSMWRIVSINETIGLDGYKTRLGLVREKIDIEN